MLPPNPVHLRRVGSSRLCPFCPLGCVFSGGQYDAAADRLRLVTSDYHGGACLATVTPAGEFVGTNPSRVKIYLRLWWWVVVVVDPRTY